MQVFPRDQCGRSPPHSLAGHNVFPQRRHLCLLGQPIREFPLPESADQDAPVADESGVGKRTVLQITLHQLLTFTIATSHVPRGNVSGQNAGMACCALRCVRSAPFDAHCARCNIRDDACSVTLLASRRCWISSLTDDANPKDTFHGWSSGSLSAAFNQKALFNFLIWFKDGSFSSCAKSYFDWHVW